MLEPQEQVRFSRSWIPARDLGGIARATADAVLNVSGRERGLGLELNVTRAFPDARVRVRQGDRVLYDKVVTLTPRATWRTEVERARRLEGWTFELLRADGAVILSHGLAGTTRCRRPTSRRGPGAPFVCPQAQTGRRLTPGAGARRRVERPASRCAGHVSGGAGPISAGRGAQQGRRPSRHVAELGRARRGHAGVERQRRARYRVAGVGIRARHHRHGDALLPGPGCSGAGPQSRRPRATSKRRSDLPRPRLLPACSWRGWRRARATFDRALRWLRALVDAEPDNTRAGALEVACLRRAKQPSRARERLGPLARRLTRPACCCATRPCGSARWTRDCGANWGPIPSGCSTWWTNTSRSVTSRPRSIC